MKRIVLSLAVLAVAVASAGAAGALGVDGLKDYRDYDLGFEGMAGAVFSGNVFSEDNPFAHLPREERIQGALSQFEKRFTDQGLEILPKLRKETQWLAYQALGEWDLEEGDMFDVVIVSDLISQILTQDEFGFIVMAAIIEDSSGNYSYMATYIGDKAKAFEGIHKEK